MPDNEDTKTELIRRIWRLVGERGEVMDKRAELRLVVLQWAERKAYGVEERAPVEKGAGMIETAVEAGLNDCDQLIVEALALLAQVDAAEDEAANDEPDGGGDDEG